MKLNQLAIKVKGLTKVFAPSIKRELQAFEQVKQGLNKADLLQKFGCTLALDNINLEVKGGELFVIMGLSGSGKSTLIRNLNRLIEPTSGHLWIHQTLIKTLSTRQMIDFRRKHLSMVFQRFALFPHLNVLDNVAYGLKICSTAKADRYKKAMEWIARVELQGYEKQYPKQLSGGMQQRVGLARALAMECDILLMDEPFSALDPLIRRQMQKLLLTLQNELKKTIVFITHDLQESIKLGDKIVILRQGSIIQQGKPNDILDNPADDYVKSFVQEAF